MEDERKFQMVDLGEVQMVFMRDLGKELVV